VERRQRSGRCAIHGWPTNHMDGSVWPICSHFYDIGRSLAERFAADSELPPSVIKRRFEFLNPTSIEINDSENELIIHTKSDVFHLVTEPVRLPLGDWKVTEISVAGIPEPADGSVFSVTPQYIRVMKQCREFYIVELIMFNKQIVGLNSGLNSDGCEALIPDTNIEKYVHLSQGLFISRFDDSTLILGGPDQSSAATQLTLTKTADYEEPPAAPEPISEPPATEGFEATDTTPSP
jgi:hypothetical protein